MAGIANVFGNFFGGTYVDQDGNFASITEVQNAGVDTGKLKVRFAQEVRPGEFPGTKTVPEGEPAFIDVDFTDVGVTVRGTAQLGGHVVLWSNDTLWLRQNLKGA
ncbi:MAG: hypothetical protein JNN08_16190 [Bryobacterales bacterium]|nr:hypothetical protein [Bryobacterales bacterium]